MYDIDQPDLYNLDQSELYKFGCIICIKLDIFGTWVGIFYIKNSLPFVSGECTFSFQWRLCFPCLQTVHLKEVSLFLNLSGNFCWQYQHGDLRRLISGSCTHIIPMLLKNSISYLGTSYKKHFASTTLSLLLFIWVITGSSTLL